MRLFLLSIFLVIFNANAAGLDGVNVSGGFCSAQNGAPMPGVTVSLLHPQLGRSAPSTTNIKGRFDITNIKPHPQPYVIEVTWGAQIIYSATVRVVEKITLPMRCI